MDLREKTRESVREGLWLGIALAVGSLPVCAMAVMLCLVVRGCS